MTKPDISPIARVTALAFKRHEITAPVAGEPDADDLERTSGQVRVRRMRIVDLRLLASRIDVTYLDYPFIQTDRSGVFAIGLRTLRPFNRLAPVTNLAFVGDDDFAGVIQFRQTAPDRRWTALAVGLTDNAGDGETVTEQLLEYSIRRAGRAGVKRLFARIPLDCEYANAFGRAGFEPYMSESILQIPELQRLSIVSGRVREQEAADTWAVHQLYHASAPKQVQYAEAWTSHRWDPVNTSGSKPAVRFWVIDEGHQIAAHARVVHGNHRAIIETMYLPDRADCGIELVRDIARRIGAESSRCQISVVARGHQAELIGALHDLGVVLAGEQHLAVRYTAVKVSGKTVDVLAPSPLDVRERVPKRVPSFMDRPTNDRIAP